MLLMGCGGDEPLVLFNIDDKVDEDVFVFTSGAVLDMSDEDDEVAPASSQPGIRQSTPAEFMSRSHRTTGQAFLITDGNQTVLRIEDLRTDNGPNLVVYLVPISGTARASEYDDDFVDLGDLRGNIGDQFYEVPAGTDLSRYSTAVIWEMHFNVAFGTVELNQIPAS